MKNIFLARLESMRGCRLSVCREKEGEREREGVREREREREGKRNIPQ